jgi:hypothetical protein
MGLKTCTVNSSSLMLIDRVAATMAEESIFCTFSN